MKKTLIAYASITGSTKEVAERIGEVLKSLGKDVTVQNIENTKSINEYEFLVIGSPVRVGKLVPQTLKFAKMFASSIALKETAYFIVCLAAKNPVEENLRIAESYMEPLIKIKEPVLKGFFAGKFELLKISPILRFFLSRNKEITEGDFRNWNEIETWAKELSKYI